jgi:hypothetical protein
MYQHTLRYSVLGAHTGKGRGLKGILNHDSHAAPQDMNRTFPTQNLSPSCPSLGSPESLIMTAPPLLEPDLGVGMQVSGAGMNEI